MQQLIIDGVYLPEVRRGQYKCYESVLTQDLEMISGRMVKEYRGKVQIIEYTADYIPNTLLRQIMAVLRGEQSFTVSYLPDDSNSMVTSTFLTTSITPPVFEFDRFGNAYWNGLAFTLREVYPHD